ncbi:MAG TPA: aminotransferase class I/II-fold pyridoxal phosphate-dependent enzyme [Bacillota bacterium]|nr:aminotransferase class I/II-fold pyridoxal phosphate-dependent enzyme [Bacillota bacterium]
MTGEGYSSYPILDALQKQLPGRHRFHVPAHCVLPYQYWSRYDLTELPGLDHLYHPQGCIAAAQELAAAVFRAEKTFFLVNGSSAGLMAAILAFCRPGETLLVGRNSHRSVAAGLILSGARPEFIPVAEGPAGIPLNITIADAAHALNCSATARGLLVTSPNYWGVSSDLVALNALLRQRGMPLLVDEAHGGHFIFHEIFPGGAACSGATLWVNSGHKTLGALTPGAYLHVRENIPELRKLEEALSMLQTASPPYPVLLSLDLARGWLEKFGHSAFDAALETAFRLRRAINESHVFQCLEQHDLPHDLQLDPLRLTIYWNKFPLSGYRLSELLHERGIEVEMAGPAYLVALVHPGLTADAATALLRALQDMEQRFGTGSPNHLPEPYPLPALKLSPREAATANTRMVPLREAAGLIAAQLVTPFPPGVPVLYPGEIILSETIARFEADLKAGVHFQDLTLKPRPLLSVVAE